MSEQKLSLVEWISAVETILADKHGTIIARLPPHSRPTSNQWEDGLTPEEAVDLKLNPPDYDVLHGDVRIRTTYTGGFVHVELYDADDYDRFLLDEDSIVALRDYLNGVIQAYNL